MTARKRGQEVLTRDRVVAEALRIVDAEGASALTMRRLGGGLGVDPTTVYYHVPNKRALEDLVVDAVMNEVDLGGDEADAPVADRIMIFFRAVAETLLAHPQALPFFAARSLTTPASLRPIEHLLGILHDAGLDYTQSIAITNCVFYYVLGGAGALVAGQIDPDVVAKSVNALRELPADAFPHLQAASAGPLMPKDDELELGARALIFGLLNEAGSDYQGRE